MKRVLSVLLAAALLTPCSLAAPANLQLNAASAVLMERKPVPFCMKPTPTKSWSLPASPRS